MVATLRISPNQYDAYDATQKKISHLEKKSNSADSFFNMCECEHTPTLTLSFARNDQ